MESVTLLYESTKLYENQMKKKLTFSQNYDKISKRGPGVCTL